MKRRQFIASTLAASCLASGSVDASAAVMQNNTTQKSNAAPEFYELRLYHLRRGPKTKLIDDYFSEVAIPAMNRSGIGAVGAFNVMIGPDSPTLYVLIPHKSFESFAALSSRLAADADYQKAVTAYNNIQATDPAYVRLESSLMVAFPGMPKLEAPAKKPRIFELRIYESHNERANKKKIEMFDTGETAIFRRTGLQPVFFGETLIGPRMPNLTYMLTFENMAARDKNWATFVADPEWKKLSSTPGFTDPEIVSSISSAFLRPTAYSQV